jgi:hypothetical protein
MYDNKMKNKKYHTVGRVLKYYTVGRVLKYYTVGRVLKYHTVGRVPKFNGKIAQRVKFDTPNTQTHDRSLSYLGTVGVICLSLKKNTSEAPKQAFLLNVKLLLQN